MTPIAKSSTMGVQTGRMGLRGEDWLPGFSIKKYGNEEPMVCQLIRSVMQRGALGSRWGPLGLGMFVVFHVSGHEVSRLRP